jgi:hypothetical protein
VLWHVSGASRVVLYLLVHSCASCCWFNNKRVKAVQQRQLHLRCSTETLWAVARASFVESQSSCWIAPVHAMVGYGGAYPFPVVRGKAISTSRLFYGCCPQPQRHVNQRHWQHSPHSLPHSRELAVRPMRDQYKCQSDGHK